MTRSQSESRPDRAAVFARVMKVLDIVQELAIADATSTQRDVYYRLGDLMPETLMRTSAQAYQAIEHAASLLGKTPADLGIACASKVLQPVPHCAARGFSAPYTPRMACLVATVGVGRWECAHPRWRGRVDGRHGYGHPHPRIHGRRDEHAARHAGSQGAD